MKLALPDVVDREPVSFVFCFVVVISVFLWFPLFGGLPVAATAGGDDSDATTLHID